VYAARDLRIAVPVTLRAKIKFKTVAVTRAVVARAVSGTIVAGLILTRVTVVAGTAVATTFLIANSRVGTIQNGIAENRTVLFMVSG
jgi:hypothetical protein